MALSIGSVDNGNGKFINPSEYQEHVALLIEPKRYEPQVPSQFGPRDMIYGTLTAFKTEANISDDTPEVVEAIIDKPHIVRPLEGALKKNEAVVVVIGQSKPKPGQRPAWIINNADAKVTAKVAAWYEAREAAIAADMDDAPDF